MLLSWQMLLPYRLEGVADVIAIWVGEKADVIAFVADVITTWVIILILVLCC